MHYGRENFIQKYCTINFFIHSKTTLEQYIHEDYTPTHTYMCTHIASLILRLNSHIEARKSNLFACNFQTYLSTQRFDHIFLFFFPSEGTYILILIKFNKAILYLNPLYKYKAIIINDIVVETAVLAYITKIWVGPGAWSGGLSSLFRDMSTWVLNLVWAVWPGNYSRSSMVPQIAIATVLCSPL